MPFLIESKIDVKTLGLGGVNVDKDPLLLGSNQLRKSQNAIHDPLGVAEGIRKRPGLTPFNTSTLGGLILGGIAAPVTNYTPSTSTANLFLGRVPTS